MFLSVRSASLLCFLLLTSVSALPSEFSIQLSFEGIGEELVWSPSEKSLPVRPGDARPEFRISGGRLFGYPREINDQLRLPISETDRKLLQSVDGETLEVWSSGRRLDGALWTLNNEHRTSTSLAASATTGTPTTSVDPASFGIYSNTRRSEYSLPGLRLKGYRLPIEVIAEVTDAPDAPGARPLILFLHGRHTTCYKGGPTGMSALIWPCIGTWRPIPSHKGYRYIADILASQGYIVVSISANGINAQDFFSMDYGVSARSQLIHHHLRLWAKWNTDGGDPWNNLFRDGLDMSKVVLVGHSRGGEGVNRAAIDAVPADPYKIVGLVSYGSTAFGRQVTPDLPSVVILPTCDGDVSDLQGQTLVDASRDIAYSEALRSAVIAIGCNHNYFNTEWTPGLAEAPAFDDWFYDSDPTCGSIEGDVRLTASEQQAVSAAYTAALVKLVINQDASLLPLLDGTYIRPSAIGRAEVATSAVGGASHRYFYRPEFNDLPILSNGMQGFVCFGTAYLNFVNITSYLPPCGQGAYFSTPHWLPITSRPSSQALELTWTNATGATAEFLISSSLQNCSGLDWIDVRIANDPFQGDIRFELLILDQNGNNARLTSNLATISGWPGSGFLNRVHARTLRFSLSSTPPQMDLSSALSISLIAQSLSGRVWVLDVAASKQNVVIPAILNLPRLSIEPSFAFGKIQRSRYDFAITTDQPLSAPVSVFAQAVYSSGVYEASEFFLDPGTSTVVLQLTLDNGRQSQELLIEAVNGVATGNYIWRK